MPTDEYGEEYEYCWDCNEQVVNEANSVGVVGEGDYVAFICPSCGLKPENEMFLYVV